MSRPALPAQHLSDEAVAAYADGVLSATARGRADRHIAGCPECAHAVRVQREAVWALRAAPAPALPSGLLDRLRELPATTPLGRAPAAMSADGSALFRAFGTSPADRMAMLPAVPQHPRNLERIGRRHGALGVLAVATIAAIGAASAGVAAAGGTPRSPAPEPASRVTSVGFHPAPAVNVVSDLLPDPESTPGWAAPSRP